MGKTFLDILSYLYLKTKAWQNILTELATNIKLTSYNQISPSLKTDRVTVSRFTIVVYNMFQIFRVTHFIGQLLLTVKQPY